MDLQSIKVSVCYESETNPRGTNFDDASFKDLVASVKEKGVLVPVLVRAGTLGMGQYEVIAGSRRLRAAKAASLKEIPANVVEMTDVEAREAQIVENLQRQDIHPMEEGQAYRDLIETGKLSVKDVSIKVGKSETYVRDRLFLTNLCALARKSYRSGKIVDSVAVLIAKLSDRDQVTALEYAEDEYDKPTASDMKEWIRREFGSSLSNQPWLRDKEAIKVLPSHVKNCHPNDTALFGDLKEGQCTDFDCWNKRMLAWTKYRQEKVPEMLIVSLSYGGSHTAGVMSRNSFVAISAKKDRCKFVVPGIVGEGEEIGKELAVCVSKDCVKHFSQQSEYKRTPKEEADRKAARKKELDAQKKALAAKEKRLADALGTVTWPLKDKHLDALLALAFDRGNSNEFRNIAKRHQLEAKKQSNAWGSDFIDYMGAVKAYAAKLDKADRAKLAFELLIDSGYDNLHKGVGKLVA